MACEEKQTSLIRFNDGLAMEKHLAGLIACHLALAIAQKGRASMALSGGQSPRGLYTCLSKATLDWAKVQITLVDERWVDENDPASNAKLLRQTLLQGEAAKAQFTGLRGTHKSPEAAALAVNKTLDHFARPFDAVVLGMGEDGHTASWFAGADGLAAALDAQNPALCVPIVARQSPVAGDHRTRLTLTLAALKDTSLCVLLLRGEGKARAYEKARQSGPVEAMPIRAILRRPPGAFWPCWAP